MYNSGQKIIRKDINMFTKIPSNNCLKDYIDIIQSDFFLIGPVVAFIWKNDAMWSIETLSKNIKNHFGYSDELFLSGRLDYASIIHPDDIQRVVGEVKEACEWQKTSFNHQLYRIKDVADNYQWVKDSTAIIYDDNGKITHFMGYIVSVNEEIKANSELTKLLQSQKEELQTIFDTTKDGIAVLDLETNFKKVNKAYCDITGFSEDELLATSCVALTHPDDIEKTTTKVIDLFQYGHIDSYEKRCVVKDKIINASLSITMFPDGKHMLVSMK
ncbi:MAG: PAS domain-containing protein, partial [Arcobacter sp.]|nr:PAS domain-containing protein [Arcobacter sp.]